MRAGRFRRENDGVGMLHPGAIIVSTMAIGRGAYMQDHYSLTTMPFGKGCCPVDPQIVDRMRAMVTYRTDEALNARFGISYNTWRKLIAGQPIRASLLNRLAARLETLEAQGEEVGA